MKEDIIRIVVSNIESEASFLNHISEEIWKNPELKFEEKQAHDLLSNALETKGFKVQKNFILPTAFRADFDTGKTIGCEWALEEKDVSYQNVITDKVLAERYKKYAESFGVNFNTDPINDLIGGSSDMGNVSHVIPSIHPIYSIGTRAPNHSKEFTKASNTEQAQATTLITAKSMALLALDVLWEKGFLDKVKEQFQEDVNKDVEE